MISYLSRLERMTTAHTLAPRADSVVAWLSGQSSFEHSQLSPGQSKILSGFEKRGWSAVYAGFPYNSAAMARSYSEANLIAASYRNTAQFIAALTSRRFQRECARHLQPLIDRAGKKLTLLAGSCGAQLFFSSVHWLRTPSFLDIHLVGVGPVGWPSHWPPSIRWSAIKGKSDWLSVWMSPPHTSAWVSGGHLHYTQRRETEEALQQLCPH